MLKLWTPEDDSKLREALEADVSLARIAGMFKRSTSAVTIRARKLGFKYKTVSERKRALAEPAPPIPRLIVRKVKPRFKSAER